MYLAFDVFACVLGYLFLGFYISWSMHVTDVLSIRACGCFILNTIRFLLIIHFRVAFVTDAGGPAFSTAFFIEYIFV